MKVSEVKKKFIELLIPLSAELDYKINKGQFLISKSDKNRTSYLHFTHNSWFDEVQIMPFVDVNIKEINEIWTKFDDYISYTYSMNLRELRDWFDIGEIDFEKFKVNNGNRFSIMNYETDIDNSFQEIKNLFLNYGLKYIQDFGSVNGVDILYNKNYKDLITPHCAGFQVKSIVGLISAKLSGNQNYTEILDFYTSIINQHKSNDTMRKQDIAMFFKIKDYLG